MSDVTEYSSAERADMRYAMLRGVMEGRHRAIRQHAFVPHPRGENFGCNRPEDDDPDCRCGYYRHHHPTMLSVNCPDCGSTNPDRIHYGHCPKVGQR